MPPKQLPRKAKQRDGDPAHAHLAEAAYWLDLATLAVVFAAIVAVLVLAFGSLDVI
jgi:hypothetical protein